MDKIWVETLERLDDLESRVGRIELTGLTGNFSPLITEPDSKSETFPEQQQRKAKEAVEGYKSDRKFVNGVEQTD